MNDIGIFIFLLFAIVWLTFWIPYVGNDIKKSLLKSGKEIDFSREDAQVKAATENVKAATDAIPHPDPKP